MRYWQHPESDSLWASTRDEFEGSDGLIEELTLEEYRERGGCCLQRVRSGGQNGVDQAALRAAQDFGLETKGWVPKGWMTLDGPQEDLLRGFGCSETNSLFYPARTSLNVKEADATLRLFYNENSPGERLTRRFIDQFNKPWADVDLRFATNQHVRAVAEWIKKGEFEELNVAGNSEKTAPGIGDRAYLFLAKLFEILGFQQ